MTCSGRLADRGVYGRDGRGRDPRRLSLGSGLPHGGRRTQCPTTGAVFAATVAHQGCRRCRARRWAGCCERAVPSSLGRLAAPRPLRAPLTPSPRVLDTLSFNDDGSMLVMASKRVPDALRVMHTASGSAFSNWPAAQRAPAPQPWSLGLLRPSSGYLSIGNDRGRVLL